MDPFYGRALLQWPVTLATLTIFGTAAFAMLADRIDRRGSEALQREMLTVWRLMAATIVLVAPPLLVTLAAEMAGTSWSEAIPVLPEVIAETHAGHAWLALMPSAAAVFAGTFLPVSSAAKTLAVLGLGALLMFAQAMLSHAIDHGTFAVFVYFIHEAAAGAWLGALAGLWIGARRARLPMEWTEGASRVTSRVAFWSVGAIVLSGAYTAWQSLGLDWYRLIYSSYGRTLTFKLVAFSIVVSFGAYNRERLMPEIARADAQELLLRNVGIESVLLGTIVLGFATLLANTPPATGHMHSGMAMMNTPWHETARPERRA
jgi:putative copper resistance protein D